MNEEKRTEDQLAPAEKAAVASSVSILVAGLIYWAIQIQNVRELLELAYG